MKRRKSALFICLALLINACTNGSDNGGITDENSSEYTFRSELFQKGLLENGIVKVTPAIKEANYSYLCLNEFDGTPAEERAQKSHELATSRQYSGSTRFFTGNIGNQYQSSWTSKAFSKNIIEPYGCRMTRIRLGKTITENTAAITVFLIENGIQP